jgi:steroid delta-isomerase-like uncharacterized protein
MDAAEVRGVIERYLQVWNRHDAAGLASCHAVDGILDSPMYATRSGRPSIEDAYCAFFTSFPDAIRTVDAVIVEPPRVALFSTIAATHVNDFFGLPGTGRHIEFRFAQQIEMREGLMQHVRSVYDFTGLLVQIGVLRAKPARP